MVKVKAGMIIPLVVACIVGATVLSCSISYKFNGSSINYDKIKTVTIEDFPNRAAYVYGPMAPAFNNRLADVFAQQTKLRQVKRGGDLVLSGEIVSYDQLNKQVSADGYSAQTQLRMTVNVRFTNNTKHDEDFERQFTATREYDSSQQLTAVQDELMTQMVKDIVDQIFNATVANW